MRSARSAAVASRRAISGAAAARCGSPVCWSECSEWSRTAAGGGQCRGRVGGARRDEQPPAQAPLVTAGERAIEQAPGDPPAAVVGVDHADQLGLAHAEGVHPEEGDQPAVRPFGDRADVTTVAQRRPLELQHDAVALGHPALELGEVVELGGSEPGWRRQPHARELSARLRARRAKLRRPGVFNRHGLADQTATAERRGRPAVAVPDVVARPSGSCAHTHRFGVALAAGEAEYASRLSGDDRGCPQLLGQPLPALADLHAEGVVQTLE